MLQTLERTVLSAEPTCETRLLDAGDAPALRPVGEHEHMAACHLDMEVNDLG